MGISIWQILIIVLVIVLLFGSRKIPALMRDVGQGMTAFKRGIRTQDDEDQSKTVDEASPAVESQQAETTSSEGSSSSEGDRKSGGRRRTAAKT